MPAARASSVGGSVTPGFRSARCPVTGIRCIRTTHWPGVTTTVFRQTVCLAERLEVPVVVTFSGCPGDAHDAAHPNWVTTAWPPEMLEVLDWQWEQKVIPYWSDASRFAADHGVKVALEAHPGFVVYNVDTALRLRAATRP